MNNLSGETCSAVDLRTSEMRYRRLFEMARDGILLLDHATHKITDANPYMTELLGYSHDELLGKELWEIGLPGDEVAGQSAYRDLQTKPTVRFEELLLQTQSGQRREVEFVSNIYEEEGVDVVQCNIRDITHRKAREARLHLLNSCIENLNDIILVTKGEWHDEPGPQIVFANRAFERISGYTQQEIIGRSPRFLQGKNTDSKVLVEIQEALRQKRPIRRHLMNYCKDGSEYWTDMAISPVFDNEGGCTHYVAIEREITDEKKALEQLIWKTTFLEAMVHSSLDGIVIVDTAGNKILQNQHMVDLWQIPVEYASEADDTKQLAWVTQQVRHPVAFLKDVQWLYDHPEEIGHDEIALLDGRVFDRYSAPVRDKAGQCLGRIWAIRDITQRKRNEERLVEQAALLDQTNDAIIVRDLAGHVLFWNRGAEQMYGWSREEVLGKTIPELFYDTNAEFAEVNKQTLAHGGWTGELRHLTKNRTRLTVEVRATLVRDADGNPKSVLAINNDITEKKKLEAQYLRVQRMESIGTLAGGIAHDLNNILAPIMMSIEMLKEMFDKPQARDILATIEVSAQRGADIVRQLLSFARGVEGERVAVQLKPLLKDLRRIISDTFPKDIRLQFSLPGDAWAILGDPTQIYQVLLNLCVNARDAMQDGGNLTITVENCLLDEHYAGMSMEAKAGHFVKIAVVDNGAGMPAEVVDKIFEPFFTTKDVNKGTGLGLSTVMAIVKSHEGFLNVYSEPGVGSTFMVYLPATDTESETARESEAQLEMPRGNGETVLVVDDEPAILQITCQTLQTYGYNVLTASNGAKAVATYAQHPKTIALVLTDMMMPIMDGAATIHALLNINPSIKIIAASGLGASGSIAKNTGLGVRHFLTKPYTAETLLKRIRQSLDEK